MTVDHFIDLVDRVEPVEIIKPYIDFVGDIIIYNNAQVLREVKVDHAGADYVNCQIQAE